MNKLLVLAGGLGTRLKSAVPDLPKVLAPINDKPFIHYIIDHYLKNGIDHFVFLLGYKSELIIKYIDLHLSHISKEYIIEKEQMGTGGAIQMGLKAVKDEYFFATNGDTFFDVDLQKLKSAYDNFECVIALKHMQQFDRYGSVTLNENDEIVSFNEKKYCESGLINAGFYLINREKFLQHRFPDKFSFEKDYLENRTINRNLKGFVSDGYFIDIGIPEDYLKAQLDLPSLK